MKRSAPHLAFLASICAAAAQPTHAQVQTPGFFGSLSGWYHFSGNNDDFLAAPSGFVTGKPGPGDGFGGGLRAGYAWSGWDVALALRHTWYTKGHGSIPAAPLTLWERASNGVGDLEVGYSTAIDSLNIRLALGPRLVWWRQHGEASNGGAGLTRYFAGGGVAKIDVAWAIAPSWSLFGGIEGSLTHGKTRGDFGTGKLSRPTTATNLGAALGVAYEIAPLVNVGIGYQVDAWWSAGRDFDILSGALIRGNNHVNHGPFIRLAYNWGAPPMAPVAQAPAPAPTGGKSFIVFFDFDRAHLTPMALETIRQAAAQAKAGRNTRIDVTGHADRAGSEAYNMALSLRRANAVKDQLVREGVPASQIVVVGRGESQPLVPTADNVREPQNRRVEIVLN